MAEENVKLPQPDYNLEQRIIKDSVDVTPIDTSLPYQSINDLIPDMSNQVDEDYRKSVAMYKGFMDDISPATLANISFGAEAAAINASPTPTNPNDTGQQIKDIWSAPLETELDLPSPIYANQRSINFDKVYNSDVFSDIGFTPYADMDKVLNANESNADYLSRALPQAQRLFRSGRFSSYRSIADIFDGDYLSSPDLEGAFVMEDAMRIGGSTTGSIGGFLGNTALNWSYSAGIIYQIALEEVVAAGVAALGAIPSGGTSLAGFSALTLKNLAQLTRIPQTISRGFKASQNLFRNFNNIRYAKDFYDVARLGKSFAIEGAHLITPELAHTIKNWKTTGNTFQNAYNIGKNTQVFGAFYRDMRMYNAALAEAKMEAGLVYNTVMDNGMKYANYENQGKGITSQQMLDIQRASNEASWKTLAPNFAVIAASNRIVFKNVFGSWAKKLNAGTGRTLQRVLQIGPRQYAKKSKWMLKAIPQEIKAAFKLGSWRKAAKVSGGMMLRYSTKGMVEGAQEVTQEAISAATGGYYSSILREPIAGAPNTLSGFYGAAGKEIFTKQGLETFASGFLIGGMMGPYQQVLFDGIPAIYSATRAGMSRSKTFNPLFNSEVKDLAKEQRQAEEQMIDDVVAQANEMGTQLEQLNLLLDPKNLNAVMQDQEAGYANLSIALNSKYDYMNGRSETRFMNLYTKYQKGLMGIYKNMVQDFTQMSDTEIGEAFSSKDFGRKPEKIREQFQQELKRINDFGERVAAKKTDKLFNDRKQDLRAFKEGTKEYRDALFQNRAIDHAKMLYIFANEQLLDASKRQMEIEQSFENEPIFTKQKYGDIRVLANAESIKTEVDMLTKEIKAKEDAGVPASELKKDKRKLKDLKRYYDILTDPANLTKKGFFNRAKTKAIKGALQTYLNGIAEDKSDYVNPETVEEVLQKLIDHSSLQEDAFAFSQAVNFLANPESMQELVNRTEEYYKFLYKNRKEVFRIQTENYISTEKKNKLINQIAEEGVYMQPELLRQFLADEIGADGLLKGLREGQFSIDGRALGGSITLTLDADKELNYKLIGLINTYRLTAELEDVAKDLQSNEQDEKNIEVEQTLQEANLADTDIGDIESSPILQNIMQREYRKYKESAFDKDALSYQDWRQSDNAVSIKAGYDALKRIWSQGYDIFVTEGGQEVTRKVVPTQKDLINEKGFQNYLDSKVAREEPLVQEVLKSLELNLDIYSTNKAVQQKSTTPPVEGVSFDIVEVPTQDGVFYKIVDKSGRNLTNLQLDIISSEVKETGTYSDLAKARQHLKILDREISDGSVFMFDGYQLSKGMSVYDRATGEEFRVNSSEVMGDQLLMVPAELYTTDYKTRYKNSKKYSELDFAKRFELEPLVFNPLPPNAQKLYSDRLAKAYPAKLPGESGLESAAQDRYKFILNELTEKEINNIIIEFNENPLRDEPLRDDRFKVTETGVPNKYIKRQRERFSISLKLDKDTTVRVNRKLEENGNLGMLEGQLLDSDGRGTFAFLPNDGLYFVDDNGKVVDPSNMSVEFARNVIIPSNNDQGMQASINQVADDFAKQEVLVSFANEKISEDQTIGTLTEGLSITVNPGIPAYRKGTNPEISIKDLNQLTTPEGGVIIYDITRDQTGNMVGNKPRIITNLDSSARNELQNKLKIALEKSGDWQKMTTGDKTGPLGGYTDRYIMPVIQPNGVVTLVTMKTASVNEAVVNQMMVDLLEQASLAYKNNTEVKSIQGQSRRIIKDKAFNDEFIKGFNNKYGEFFVAAQKGMNVVIDVAPDGAIRADLFNKYTSKGAKVYYNRADQQKEGNGLDHLNRFFKIILDSPEASTVGLQTLSTSNIRESLPVDAGVNEMLDMLVTKISPEIRTGQYISFDATQAAKAAARDKGIYLARPRKDLETMPEPTETRREDPAVARARAIEEMGDRLSTEAMENDISPEDFANFVETGVVESNIISNIADKIIAGQKLTEQEEAIRQEKAADVESLLEKQVSVEQKTEIDLTALSETPIDRVNRQIKEREKEIIAEVGQKKKIKALRNDAIYQDLLQQREDIIGPANKILSPRLSNVDVEDINVFISWAEANLPEFIRVGDIKNLGNNLKAGGIRVGAFALDMADIGGGLRAGGTLYTGASNPFRYHEAFHGVYRMLLTPEEQSRLLRIAKKEKRAQLRSEGKTLATELQKFRNSSDTYAAMSDITLENRYYEEYMADQFEIFKKNPSKTKTNTEVKSLFTRIIEWFKRMFSSFNRSELQTLYENIDSGKYANASVVANEFTLDTSPAIVVADAILPYEALQVNGSKGYLYLDSNIANNTVRSLAAMYIARRNSNIDPDVSNTDIFEDVLEDFAWLYNKENPINDKYKSFGERSNALALEQLDRIHDALQFNATSDITQSPIYKSVFEVLELIDVQKQQQEDSNEEFETNEGLRNVTQFGKEAYMSGGLASLPTYIRQYLSTITMPYTDMFGNETLEDGQKLVIPIDAYKTYNGIIKAVKNVTDPLVILQRMYTFSQDNANTRAAVQAIFNDIGIDYFTLNEISDLELPSEIKNATLFNQITKGFTNYKVDWLFMQQDKSNEVITFSAAERDDIHTQNELWGQAYTTNKLSWKIDPNKKDLALDSLDNLFNALTQNKSYKGNDEALTTLTRSLAQDLYERVGIKLSPLYIRYSILRNSNQAKSDGQNMLIQFNDSATAISGADIYWIRDLINSDADLFNSQDDGAISRLKDLAINNSLFDESIGLSVFRNVNGDLVNAHQKPTFHLERIFSLNSPTEINRLSEDKFLENNYLLNNPAFIQMSDDNIIKVSRLSGLKEVKTLDRDANIDSYLDGIVGTTDYGSFTPAQFVTTLVNNYFFDYNPRSQTLKSNIKDTALAPVQIRVLESSNTNDQVKLPIIKAVEGQSLKVTDAYVEQINNFVENEYNRIVRENSEEGNLPLQTIVKADGTIVEIPKTIEGYNVADSNGVMRMNQMFNTKDLISEELRSTLEVAAIQEQPLTFSQVISQFGKAKYNTMLRNQLDSKFDKFKGLIERLDIDNKFSRFIEKGLLDGVEGNVAQQKARNIAKALNIRADKDYNLKQIFLNDYLNTKSLNELLLGDQAMILEDSIKQIKRAKGQNASGDSIYSPVSNPLHGVFEPTENINAVILNEVEIASEFSGKNIDRADAQVYVTPKFHRHAQEALGNLTDMGALMLDKIEDGTPLTAEELYGPQGLAKNNQMLNSKKYVYFDGQTYVKFSAITLTEQLVENNPKLRKLYRNMQDIEQSYGGISFAGPKSAFKMLKTNIKNLGDDIVEPSIVLDARYFREQVRTTTNKELISEQTQIKTLATSEQVDSTPIVIEGRPDIKNIGDVRKEYNDILSNRIILKFRDKRNLIYTFEGLMSEFQKSKKDITPNLQVFLKYALNSLKASKASTNLMEFFTVDPTTGEVAYNINNPISIAKAEQLFMSYFSKGVFQEKIPGHGLALVSDAGFAYVRRIFSMEKDGRIGRTEIVRGKIPAGETILDLNPDTLGANYKFPDNGQGILVRDRLRYQLKEYDQNGKATGQYYSEAVMPAHSADIYNKLDKNKSASIPREVGKMFGVRIPSQDNHSTINIKLVDFLPAYYGSSAIFPAELVEISGADFDIDTAYVQVKETYYDKKTGRFYAYGETKGREYSDYVRYINDKVTKDNVYSQAASSFKVQGSKLEDSFTDAELLDSDFTDNALRALQRLGLPITKQEYAEYVKNFGEPYAAPLNNAALDYKYALMGNESVKDISVTPASLDAIEAAYTELKRIAPEYVARLDNENIDVDSLTGKAISFEVNKGAAIGKAVSPNLYLSLLSEYKIELPQSVVFGLRGATYDGYGEYLNQYGNRKQDEISSIITMLTDNSKENYVAKLGMHPSAVGIATNMVALGVPLTDAVLLLNGKIVRDLFTEANNKADKFDASFSSLVKNRLDALKKTNATPGVSLEVLEKSVRGETLTKAEQKSILLVLSNLNKIASFTGAMGGITSMSGNGIGSNFTDIQERLDKFKKVGILPSDQQPLLDITPILQNSWVKANVDIFNQIAFDLIPKTFITGTETFNDVYEDISRNLSSSLKSFTIQDMQKVKRDMLSFFTIRAYMQNTSKTKDSATLSNQLIYPNTFENSVFDAVNRLSIADKDNFFLQNFITMVPMYNDSNNTGLNLLQANTWRGLNKQQKVDLQTSFAKLYGNPLTRRDAMTIVNYEMVKNGLQIAKGSLLDAISPFVMDEYLQNINNVNEVFLTNKGWLETFGAERDDLVEYFEQGYFKSAVVNSKLKQVSYDFNLSGVPAYTKGYTLKDGVLEFKATVEQQTIDPEFKSAPRYLNFIDVISDPLNQSAQFFVLDRVEKTKAFYVRAEMEGSYYQNGIGFMFGDRPTTAENRDNIKNKGTIRTEYAQEAFEKIDATDFAPPVNRSVQNQALANEDATIEATENEITFTAEDTANAINIADTGALDNLLGLKKQNNKVAKPVESNISSLVSAWLKTKEGSLENQTAEQSANKFALEYAKRNPVGERDGRTVDQIAEDNKKLSKDERRENAKQTGGDLFNTIAQGMNVSSAVLSEINNQTRAELNVETEATGIVDAQENMPVETEERQQLTLNFDQEINDAYPLITSFYNGIFEVPGVRGDIVAQRDILENNNLDSLEAMVEFYNSPETNFESEEEMVDYIKKCLLGI